MREDYDAARDWKLVHSTRSVESAHSAKRHERFAASRVVIATTSRLSPTNILVIRGTGMFFISAISIL